MLHTSRLRLNLDWDWLTELVLTFTGRACNKLARCFGSATNCDVRCHHRFWQDITKTYRRCIPHHGNWKPVHFQPKVSMIAFTLDQVQSESFLNLSPTRLGGLESRPNPVWLHPHSQTPNLNPVAVHLCECTERSLLFYFSA